VGLHNESAQMQPCSLQSLTYPTLVSSYITPVTTDTPTILVRRKIKSHFNPGRLFYVSLRGSMTNPPHSTMAASTAAAPSRANSTARTASSNPPVPQVTNFFVTRDFDLALCAFFPTPTAPVKFNPILAMQNLFRVLLKDEPLLVLRTTNNDNQIVLDSASLPIGEKAFKKFFKVSTSRIAKQNQTHVCISCHVLSNRTLGNIKFRSPDGNLLAWLKKEKNHS